MSESVEAEKVAWEAIAKIQADGEVPFWIMLNAISHKNMCGDDLWKIETYLTKKIKLKRGYSWERQDDGSKTLIHVDQESGKKSYYLHFETDDCDLVKIFEVEVEVPSKQATIKKAVNLTELDRDSFEILYDEKYTGFLRPILE